MNDERALERRIAASYGASAPPREPAGLLDDILLTTSRSRQRPRWLAITKEPPMRITSGVAVGSPTARIAALAAATVLLVVMATGAVVAGAAYLAGTATIVVAQDGGGTFETVTEAIAAAEDGDTILVKPGTYVGTVVIDKDVTLKGDGPRDEIVLEFTADGPAVQTEWAAVPYGVLLADSTATVTDLTVRGPNVATAFLVIGGAPTLERVANELEGDFSGSPHTSVGLIHGASVTIRDSLFEGPIWDLGDPELPSYTDVRGEALVEISGNTLDSFLRIPLANGALVTGNTVLAGQPLDMSPGTIQIFPTGDGPGTAEVSGNRATAITFDSSTDGTGVTVRGNTLRGGDEGGVSIRLGSGSPLIEGNDIGDTEVGVTIPVDASPTIRSNVIDATWSAVMISGDTDAVIVGNRLCGDQRGALSVPEGSQLRLDPSNEEVCPAD